MNQNLNPVQFKKPTHHLMGHNKNPHYKVYDAGRKMKQMTTKPSHPKKFKSQKVS